MKKTAVQTIEHVPSRPLLKTLAFVVLTTVFVIAVSACNKKPDAIAEAAPSITGETVTFAADDASLKTIQVAKVEAPREQDLTIPGRVVWNEDRTVRVFTPFSGRVARIAVDLGTKVAVGQPLAFLQSPDFAAAQADAQRADALLKLARQARVRVADLSANGIVAAKDLQQTESDFTAAEAESNRANTRLKLYGHDSKSRPLDTRFALTSPIAGVVVERNLNPGQELRTDQPGAAQFVVTDPAQLWIQLDASESDLRSLKPGTSLLISANQYPDDTFRGEVRQVADFIDPVTRTLKIRGAIDNKDLRLKAEMFVMARVTLAKGEYPLVPEKAVFLDGVRSFAFVRTGPGVFARRAVKTLSTRGGFVPVIGGLKETEEVVVAGSLFLQQMVAAAQVRSDANQTAQAKN